MKAALAVPMQSLGWTVEETIAQIEATVPAAAQNGAQLVLFPELAATPGDNNDNPEHDLPLGQPIPGEVTDRLRGMARAHGLYIGIGMLEREHDSLYDAAVLLGPAGEIALKYRRMQPQWHGRHADPDVYREGREMVTASTQIGRCCFALCGDLFEVEIARRIRENSPDYVLWLVARNFSDGSFSQERWDRDEEPEYVAAGASTGAITLMVNRLVAPTSSDYPSFGGALVISPRGEVTARLPLATPGTLYVDVSAPVRRGRCPARHPSGPGQGAAGP